MGTLIECAYCGHEGGYGVEIETRVTVKGERLFACIDSDACDKREAALALARGETEHDD